MKYLLFLDVFKNKPTEQNLNEAVVAEKIEQASKQQKVQKSNKRSKQQQNKI